MAYVLDTIEDKLKFELGSLKFDKEVLAFELDKAYARIDELEKQLNIQHPS
jgi:hypothetical protein